jgi:NAD(P)-dependent dehydrogenase (short-subunit alcohol dehydrogenase family)
MGSLAQRTVMVTGAGVGIGSGTASALAQAGAMVIVADIDPVTGTSTANRILDDGFAAEFVELDVSDESSWTTAVEAITRRHGPITGLVNNAAVKASRLGDAGLLDTSVTTWDRIFAVNLRGAMLGSRAVLPGMLEAGEGSIVMISATCAFRGVAGFATAYSSAKAGMNGLMIAIATTYGPSGVRCNSVAPGLIIVEPSPSQDTHTDRTAGLLRRAGRTSDIASLVALLISDEGSYINGQVISVDGGMTAHTAGLSRPAVRRD